MKDLEAGIYYAFDSEIFIFTIIILILSQEEKIELIKIFIIVSILLENTIDDSYNTKNQFVHMINKAKKDISKSNFYIKTSKNIYKYKENIYDSILLAVKMDILYFDVNNEIYVGLKNKKIARKLNSLISNKFFKKIKKITQLCSQVDIDTMIVNLKIGEFI